MLTWSGYVELDAAMDRARQGALAQRLKRYAGVVASDEDHGRTSISVCVEAGSLRVATSLVLQAVREATLKADVPGEPVAVHVMPWADLADEIPEE